MQYRNVVYYALRAMGLGVIFLALLFAKVSYSARQDFARGEEALVRGEYEAAVTYYERTVKWYTPFSKTVWQATERLWQVGTEAETREEWSLALTAYRSLRAGLYAVQSFYVPHQHWIPKCEERIAMLMAKTKITPEQNAAQLAQETARFAKMFERQIGPRLGWAMVVEIGFLGWVGATVGFIWFASGERWSWRRGLLWGGSLAVFFTAWIIGMLFA